MLMLFLKGIGIGIANIMPGVSGGTLAIVFNVYDKLVEAVGKFFGSDRKQKIEYLKFLFPIFLGAATGILLFAKILQLAYLNYPKATGFGFMILILPSIPLIVKNEPVNRKNISSFISGVLLTLVFIILGLKFGKKADAVGILKLYDLSYGMKLFLSGGIAAGAMIIPGISGSLLLMMLGEYYNILFAINGAVKAIFELLKNFSLDGAAALFTSGQFLILYTFGAGIIIGILGISKFIDHMLKKYRGVTLFFIDGIVAASVIQIIINIFPALDTFMRGIFN